LVKWVRQQREAKGLDQIDVAERLGEHQSWVSRLESGQRRLDVVEFLAVAKAIGFNPHEMLRKLARVREP
jgi:transcriptional regulator with XRE-family HTH domain